MSQEPTALLQPVAAEEPSARRILIIDDDAAQVEALSLRLGRLGYMTTAVLRGEEGLAVARRSRPDLILLDLRLPDTDGFVVCAELSDAPETCSIPVIIVSAMERPDIVRQARSAGCEYFMRKPYDPNALLALIESALRETGDGEW